MRRMTKEELETEVQGGVARRLRVDRSVVTVSAYEVGAGVVGIDVKVNGTDGTPEQKALITRYLRDTIDPGAFEAPSC